MKKARLLIAAILFLASCKTNTKTVTPVTTGQETEVETTTAPEDIAWKATFTYFLVTDKIDSASVNLGLPPEVIEISHLKVTNEQGSMKDMMDVLKDGLKSGKCAYYSLDLNRNYCPDKKLGKDEIFRMDTVIDENGNRKVVEEKNELNGFTLNQEWLYNKKTQQIDSKISDMGLVWQGVYGNDLRGAFKFTERITDSTLTQAVDNPDIAWAKAMYIAIGFNAAKECNLITGTPTVNTTFNGVIGACERWAPYPLKSTFNLKLVDWIYNAAMKGKISAYKYEDDGSVGAKLSAEELSKLSVIIDTLQDQNGKSLVVSTLISLGGLEVVTEGLFDKKAFRFKSKVLRVAITKKGLNAQGIYTKNNIPLFWVKFE